METANHVGLYIWTLAIRPILLVKGACGTVVTLTLHGMKPKAEAKIWLKLILEEFSKERLLHIYLHNHNAFPASSAALSSATSLLPALPILRFLSTFSIKASPAL